MLADIQNSVRMLYRHDWQDPEEWAQSLDEVARLTDAEISGLFHTDVLGTAANDRNTQ